jgi:predicted PurR-regulated permease PerM
MAFPDRRTADVLLTILFFAVVCVAVYCARRIILVFVLAVFFAYLINPVVKFLQRNSLLFRNLRGPAVVEVYVVFVILIALLGYGFAPSLARNSVMLVDEIPVFLDGLSTGDIATELGEKYDWSQVQEARVRAFLGRHKVDVQAVVKGTDRYLSNAAQALGWLFLIPVLAIFFLRDGDRIADVLIQVLFPVAKRQRVRAVADELHMMLTKYIRAQVILCCLSFVFYSAVLVLFRFPHAMALALMGGVLEFIPMVGWLTTAAAVLGVGIVSHSHWIWMAVLLVAWRLVQDYWATPRIMGHQLEIHPLAAIFAVLVGAAIGGIVGVYLAIPVMASMGVIRRMCSEAGQSSAYYPEPTANVASSLAETAAD